jgi:hypothetical protein
LPIGQFKCERVDDFRLGPKEWNCERTYPHDCYQIHDPVNPVLGYKSPVGLVGGWLQTFFSV